MDTPIPTPADDAASVLEDAFIDYRDAGLRLPPVPRELAGELDEFADWRWGSDDVSLDDAQGFLERARDPAAGPEIAFGNIGHGMQSWWLCYRVITPAVAVFVRQPFGGAYGDRTAEAAAANETAELLEDLLVVAEGAKGEGRIPEGGRLVVMLDETGLQGWEITGGGKEWQDSPSPIEDALAFCEA